jgi:hypothetical protein
MELSETIGVTLKDGVWCWTSDTMLVAEVNRNFKGRYNSCSNVRVKRIIRCILIKVYRATLSIIQETKMEVYVDKHHIRLRHLYVMPLASMFLDEETMNGCIRKAVEWCEGLPSHDATHVQKMFV